MKLVKSLLLGTAAGFVAVAGAQAADLPSRKAAPAEYVRVCSAYGAGFWFIPGTDTCIQLGARVRYELNFGNGYVNRSGSRIGHRTIGSLRYDARTPTPWGTLRAFIRLELARRNGNLRSGSTFRAGWSIENPTATDPGGGGRAQTQVNLDAAFIQWAGITAGRASSFFEFAFGGANFNGLAGSAMGPTNVLAYTATFGSGFSATIAIEDNQERNHYIANAATLATAPTGGYNGNYYPDIVGNLRLDQPWGSVQIAGAAHFLNPITALFGANPVNSTWGFALMGGVKINLPMIAPGDALWLEATYADGAMNYIDSAPLGFQLRLAGNKKSAAFYAGDAVVNAAGTIQKAKGYGLLASFLHYWTPNLRSAMGFGYTKHNNPTGIADFDAMAASINLIWSPVRAFDIGVEVGWFRLRGDAVGLVGAGGLTRDDSYYLRLRLQRDF